MPSPRRVRLLMLAAILSIIFVLFYTTGFDSGHDAATYGSTFYDKTQQAMKDAPPGQEAATKPNAQPIPGDKDADGDVDEDDKAHTSKMQERLKVAELQAKEKANEKAPLRPDPPSNVIGVGSSAGGQHEGADADGKGASNSNSGSGSNSGAGSVDKKPEAPPPAEVKDDKQTPEKRTAKEELTFILKKAPVVIFSKSYCPFSKRAKGILLEKYSIDPIPYVVELDEHPMGQDLQDELLKTTGRRTVPNIMINSVSIGGADDIVELDNQDKLVGKIVDLGKKLVLVKERIGDGFSDAGK